MSQYHLTEDGHVVIDDEEFPFSEEFWGVFEEWYGDKAYRHAHTVSWMWHVAQQDAERIRMNNM